jgi:histidyl-tRNA synthetase
MAKITKIKGVADLFSPDSTVFSFLEQTAREVFGRYGYRELRIPIMEKTDLFARSIGEETDVVQKEMYTFPDRKGRSLTLRPEATAGVMRAYIENNRQAEHEVDRLFTFGPMFRYERPQKGRMRQFHQLDVEIIGTDRPQADAELLLMLTAYLKAIGLSRLTVEINSLGCAGCRPAYRESLDSFLAGIDEAVLCHDCLRRKDTNPLRVLDCKQEGCKTAVQNAPTLPESFCEYCEANYTAVKGLLKASGVDFVENPRLVRGLDYYVGTTFEVVSGEIGAQTAVAGGGRYDGLIKQLGGPDVPGVGFALGMERLAMLLEGIEPEPLDFYLAAIDEAGLDTVVLTAEKLRQAGLKGEIAYDARSMKSRMRSANKSGARYALLLGTDEMDAGTIMVKNMESGEQESVPLETLPHVLAPQ